MTHADDMKKCLSIRVTGRVQGVCFRYYAKMEANRLGVTGYACNMPDGSVEAMICGKTEQLGTMQQWLSHGPEMARVDNLQMHEATPERIPGHFRIID